MGRSSPERLGQRERDAGDVEQRDMSEKYCVSPRACWEKRSDLLMLGINPVFFGVMDNCWLNMKDNSKYHIYLQCSTHDVMF